MDSKPFPKVLIVGPTFSTNSGEGITMNNLFNDWSSDHLAVVTELKNLSTQSGLSEQYYQIGSEEKKWIFPFTFMQSKLPSGPVDASRIGNPSGNQKAAKKKTDKSKKNKWRYRFSRLLSRIGLYHFFFRYQVSDQLGQWIRDFQPDIVYTHATSIGNMMLVWDILKKYKVSLVVHIMDDYLNVMNTPGMTYRYWKKTTDTYFKRLLEKSAVALSICQEMSDEYEAKYGRPFIPFHNPVVLKQWLKYTRTTWEVDGTFTVMYAGRIGRGTSDSLVDIGSAVANLGEEGLDIQFVVQSTTKESPHKDLIAAKPHCLIHPPVAYEALPQKLASADLLVLPMDFDPENFSYIRLSMPTKCSEYMATGVPILVYAPEQAALVQYAKRENWAEVVDQNKVTALVETIRRLYLETERRSSLGQVGKQTAVRSHDAGNVRKAFKKLMVDAVSAA